MTLHPERDTRLMQDLGQPLRDALEEALALGATEYQLLWSVAALTGGGCSEKCMLLLLGVRAFLDQLAKQAAEKAEHPKVVPHV